MKSLQAKIAELSLEQQERIKIRSKELIEEYKTMLWLVTSLFKEGIGDFNYRVIEAESKLEIAQHMIDNPDSWYFFLTCCYPREFRYLSSECLGNLYDLAKHPKMTAERFLELIELTEVDGTSETQLRISLVIPIHLKLLVEE